MADRRITVLGSFVADLAFRVDSLPAWGETRMGASFAIGPGGKGSNQAVAAARAGGKVTFITKLGDDAFGKIARDLYRDEGIDAKHIAITSHATGAAAIILDAARGENAIIVVPGACYELTPDEVERAGSSIASSSVFLAQLELPLATVERGLTLARAHGVTTILNPAPATSLPDSIFPLCDYITPNETEAAALTGVPVDDISGAARAADVLLRRGARNVVITLGAKGALFRTRDLSQYIPAVNAGPVVETTGAGDAFNGGFAVARAEAMKPVEAARFACAVAGISVTRPGTAPSMPRRAEIDAVLAAQSTGISP